MSGEKIERGRMQSIYLELAPMSRLFAREPHVSSAMRYRSERVAEREEREEREEWSEGISLRACSWDYMHVHACICMYMSARQ